MQNGNLCPRFQKLLEKYEIDSAPVPSPTRATPLPGFRRMLQKYAMNVEETSSLPVVVRYHTILKKYDRSNTPAPPTRSTTPALVPGFRKLMKKYKIEDQASLQALPDRPFSDPTPLPVSKTGQDAGIQNLLPKFQVDGGGTLADRAR